MTKRLSLDEMLECLETLKHPTAGALQTVIEGLGDTMARLLATALDVDAGDACFEGTAFGGTCAPFRPRFPGQPCPAPLTDYDSEEWDQDNGTTDPALEQKT